MKTDENNRNLHKSVTHLRLWREEGAGHSVEVLWVDLDADIVEAYLREV